MDEHCLAFLSSLTGHQYTCILLVCAGADLRHLLRLPRPRGEESEGLLLDLCCLLAG